MASSKFARGASTLAYAAAGVAAGGAGLMSVTYCINLPFGLGGDNNGETERPVRRFNPNLPQELKGKFYMHENESVKKLKQINILAIGDRVQIDRALINGFTTQTNILEGKKRRQQDAAAAQGGSRAGNSTGESSERDVVWHDTMCSSLIEHAYYFGSTFLQTTTSPQGWTDDQKAHMKIVVRGQVEFGCTPPSARWYERGPLHRSGARWCNKPHAVVMYKSPDESFHPAKQWIVDLCRKENVPLFFWHGEPEGAVEVLETTLTESLAQHFIREEKLVQYKKGEEAGYKTGNALGKAQGMAEGYSKGLRDGHREGYREGMAEGVRVAQRQGSPPASGNTVGATTPEAGNNGGRSAHGGGSGATPSAPPEPPHAFTCPISLQRMDDPVVTPAGHSFDRSSIVEYVRRSHCDPFTRQPLSEQDLIPNRALRDAIREWDERYNWNNHGRH
eukprot:GFYU01007324.1.p1 GENE.GFYU01007324.1~~GFYU01007324.1.p1  ORF type:complete len:447 (+),score=75.30 GFYU01007324.1:52-1392(+)